MPGNSDSIMMRSTRYTGEDPSTDMQESRCPSPCKCRVHEVVTTFALLFLVFTLILLILCSKHIIKYSLKKETVFLKYGSTGNFERQDLPSRDGPGEGGRPHNLRSDQKEAARSSESKYGMNMVCSDEISLDRSIPDLRHGDCKRWRYPEILPDASVVIVFHNEGFSTLMRTVHSVMHRTPNRLLAEVLLVDDYSDEDDLKDKLESHIQRWDGTVRLIRNQKQEGLIKSRSRGACRARGKVVVFLDAHCEVNENWLPPLLAPINENQWIITVPVIDEVDKTTFNVRRVHQADQRFMGIFDWGLRYKEKEVPQNPSSDDEVATRPYKSPTAGGIFAIDREHFLELGAFDPELHIWGGENLELSFKNWLCGGFIMWVPCSRVAHVKKSSTINKYGTIGTEARGPLTRLIDRKRIVETWLDDKFKEYFYTIEPLARFLDKGDISEQLILKQNLNIKYRCRSFQWFMDGAAHDVWKDFPDPPPNLHWGRMKNVATQNCLGTLGLDASTNMSTSTCTQGFTSDQLVRFNAFGQLAIGEQCVEADSNRVVLRSCQIGTVSGPWQYKERLNVMLHMLEMKCLAVHPESLQLDLLMCDPITKYTQWKFVNIINNVWPSQYEYV